MTMSTLYKYIYTDNKITNMNVILKLWKFIKSIEYIIWNIACFAVNSGAKWTESNVLKT